MPRRRDVAGQHRGGVEVGERGRRGRVGEVVGGHVDRLHRGDRALVGGRDPLLQLAHLGGQRRLVADGAGHAAEQRRHLGAGLDEAEDVVDEEQHVLAAARRGSTRPWSGRSGRRAGGRPAARSSGRRPARSSRSRPTRSSPATGRCPRGCARPRRRTRTGRRAAVAMLLISSWISTVLPTPAPPNRPILPPFTYGASRSIDLDPGLEDLGGRRQVLEQRRVAVDLPALARPRPVRPGRPSRPAR